MFGLPQFAFSHGEAGSTVHLHLPSKSCKYHLCGIHNFGVDKAILMTRSSRSRYLTQNIQTPLARALWLFLEGLVYNYFIRNNIQHNPKRKWLLISQLKVSNVRHFILEKPVFPFALFFLRANHESCLNIYFNTASAAKDLLAWEINLATELLEVLFQLLYPFQFLCRKEWPLPFHQQRLLS